jgi:hypothetical protein
MREAAVLGELRLTSGIGNAYVGSDDDVRCAGIAVPRESGDVVVQGQRRAVVDLPDAGLGSVVFECGDGGLSVGRVGEPEQRDIVFGRSDAGRVRRGFGVRQQAGDQVSR